MASPDNRVSFPLAGEGACLRYRTADLVALEEAYGRDWQSEVITRLNGLSHKTLVDCLKHGLKKEDGRTPFTAVDLNDLPFGIYAAASEIVDAISLGITGQPYAALLEARQEATKSPPEPAKTSSRRSSGPATGRGSRRPKSST